MLYWIIFGIFGALIIIATLIAASTSKSELTRETFGFNENSEAQIESVKTETESDETKSQTIFGFAILTAVVGLGPIGFLCSVLLLIAFAYNEGQAEKEAESEDKGE